MDKLTKFNDCHKGIFLLLVAVTLFSIFNPNTIFACSHNACSTSIIANPTCVDNGTAETVCINCGEVLNTFSINPIEHSFGEWIKIVDATSEKDGIEIKECQNCTFKEERNVPYVFISSSPDITLSYEYIESDEFMPYGFITPSSAKDNDKTPLIISLHGMGELRCSKEIFENKFVVKTMRNWNLDGFNAYVLFPHLSGSFYSSSWNGEKPAENVFNLIDHIIEKYNIDTDKIIIQGQSMGGYGCLYMAAYRPDFFSAVVPISPYNSNADLNKIENTAFRCYVGKATYGEDNNSIKFAFGKLSNVFGTENIFQRNASHNEIPIIAFTEDSNNDNKSDLIEWMLSQTKER